MWCLSSRVHRSYSLNCVPGDLRDCLGEYYRCYFGDTRSLDYSSYRSYIGMIKGEDGD